MSRLDQCMMQRSRRGTRSKDACARLGTHHKTAQMVNAGAIGLAGLHLRKVERREAFKRRNKIFAFDIKAAPAIGLLGNRTRIANNRFEF